MGYRGFRRVGSNASVDDASYGHASAKHRRATIDMQVEYGCDIAREREDGHFACLEVAVVRWPWLSSVWRTTDEGKGRPDWSSCKAEIGEPSARPRPD